MKRLAGLLVIAGLGLACGRTRENPSLGPISSGAGAGAGTGMAGGGSSGTGQTGEGGVPAPCTAPSRLAPAGLRPLGQAELRNELAVFGEPLAEMELPARFSRIHDLYEGGPNNEQRELDGVFLDRHAKFVTGLIERVTADAAGLGKLLSCDIGTDAALCNAHLFDFVMDRLFRGLADDATAAQVEAVFAEGEGDTGGFQGGAGAVLAWALQNPGFLYHVERGRPVTEDGVEKLELTDLELASQLSFLLWGSGPDSELLKLARAGRLSEPSELAAAAQRLLADPRAELGIARFYRELLGIDEGRRFDADSGVPPEVLTLMDRELSSFVWHATVDPGKGDLAALLEPVTWVNGALADYYGWPKVAGDDFRAVTLEPTRYAGLLTLPAWLTRASGPASTHPSMRGWWLARGLLCTSVPPEPEGVNHPAGPPNLTERQRFAEHASVALCAGCHQAVDPPGLALEHFDALGRYREEDDGLTIDTSNLPTRDGSGSFDGVPGLVDQVMKASANPSCLAQQWVRFALGGAALDSPASDCATELEQLTPKLKSVPEFLVRLTQTEAFRYRAPAP